MELTKEIELFILTRIAQKKEVSENDFQPTVCETYSHCQKG